jgi:hypothetical protein
MNEIKQFILNLKINFKTFHPDPMKTPTKINYNSDPTHEQPSGRRCVTHETYYTGRFNVFGDGNGEERT